MFDDAIPADGLLVADNNPPYQRSPRLLDKVRNVIRCKHYSIRTEQSYVDWIKRYIYFHKKQHPKDMGETHISDFLTHLAVDKKVASSTQNQALCALVFLYREVIKKEIGDFGSLIRAKKPQKLPVVFTREEVKQILLQLSGANWLMGQLIYGAGLRVMECVRLRVKDVDFGYGQIVVRDGKGKKDRVTMLPDIIVEELQRNLLKIKKIHDLDLKAGFGAVYLPYAVKGNIKTPISAGLGNMFSRRPGVPLIRARASNVGIIFPKPCPSVRSERPSAIAELPKRAVAIHCVTVLPPICLKQAMIFERFRSF